jgi:hypothetical protein
MENPYSVTDNPFEKFTNYHAVSIRFAAPSPNNGP